MSCGAISFYKYFRTTAPDKLFISHVIFFIEQIHSRYPKSTVKFIGRFDIYDFVYFKAENFNLLTNPQSNVYLKKKKNISQYKPFNNRVRYLKTFVPLGSN